MQVAVIGGGAAGFFAAISAKHHHPDARVQLFEKTNKLLAKVKVSGGGRCNVTHHCMNNRLLSANYPRGEKFLRKAFEQFSVTDTISWFGNRGVELIPEADNRMFPHTNSSQTIIDCLTNEANKLGVEISCGRIVSNILPSDNGFQLKIDDAALHADFVIIATGGSPKLEGLRWLADLGHTIVNPVPSLFTFNMPNEPICSLMGVSVANADVRVTGTSISASGPMMITHWGLSGPAVLKCSAFGARALAEANYDFQVMINWLGDIKEHTLRMQLETMLDEVARRQIANKNPFALPARLWEFLLQKSEINGTKPWMEISKKSLNKLINTLLNDVYHVKGKTTFKEEFVTAGGVALTDVNAATMQSLKVPGIYFTGEVLDIDGVTGGFNFQAAWTTGFIAGKLQK